MSIVLCVEISWCCLKMFWNVHLLRDRPRVAEGLDQIQNTDFIVIIFIEYLLQTLCHFCGVILKQEFL